MNRTTTPDQLVLDDTFRRQLGRWIRSSADADDILQIVAEKLVSSPIDKGPDYVSRMVRNAAIDHHRAENRREQHHVNWMEQSDQIDERTPEDSVAADQAMSALQEAIDNLSPVTRQIFLQFHFEGMTQPEIAKGLDVHLSTVEKRLARARKNCFAILGRYLD